MGENLQGNPFAALFSSVTEAQGFLAHPTSPLEPGVTFAAGVELPEACNNPLVDLARDVFLITFHENSDTPLVYLEEMVNSVGRGGSNLSISLLGEAIFERLLLSEPEQHVRPRGTLASSHIIESHAITFLYESWKRLQNVNVQYYSKTDLSEVSILVLQNTSTALMQSEMFPTQNLSEQFMQLCQNEDLDQIVSFLGSSLSHLVSDCSPEEAQTSVDTMLRPVLDELFSDAINTSIMSLNQGLLRTLLVLARSGHHSAALLLEHSKPREGGVDKARAWSETLLGCVLNVSCLPDAANRDQDCIFNDVVAQPSLLHARENSTWMALGAITEGLHAVFEALLRSSAENRASTLSWLWRCLEMNASRGSLWSSYNPSPSLDLSGVILVSDGFALNLETVILRLCAPFCNPPSNQLNNEENEEVMHPKLLTVDPSFCAVQSGPNSKGGYHDQTCLLPIPNNDEGQNKPVHPTAASFSFLTECFFLAHRAIDIGSRVAREHMSALSQETGRIERALQQMGPGSSAGIADQLRTSMETTAGKFFAYRAALMEPTMIEQASRFYAASASWIIQVLMDDTPLTPGRSSYAPGQMRPVEFPLPGEEDGSTRSADHLQLVPELIVENIASFVTMSRSFHPNTLEEPWLLRPLFTMVVALMGSPGRTRNPHLRARMAEVLGALLPWGLGEDKWSSERKLIDRTPVVRFQRERLFLQHPHRLQVAESLLQVFVGIEMTGQSVAFEQKFNYRRPMYVVLDHLWSLPEHRECFKRLASAAQENMEAINPPLFLRFSNLLMNDAVYLLDEALAHMVQLKQKQAERESGAWDSLDPRIREQNLRNLQHMSMNARFHNILGRETVHTLEMLTSEIRSLFCHPTMVDRMAAMLNYFLLQLVGPNSKSFKVNNLKEFDFMPAKVVLDISRIYVNLGGSEDFCAAVSRDGRSYNDTLFPRAQAVLARIGGAALLADLQTVERQVAQHALRQSCDDELLADAPDEFLDPITAAIMVDPVMLPSSQVAIDRATIARHLLSDQSDPFNRSPLTMDQVQPDVELKSRIEEWIALRRKSSRATPESSSSAMDEAGAAEPLEPTKDISGNFPSDDD